MDIPKLIKQIKTAGITQKKLAEDMGVSENTVSRWKKDKRAWMSSDNQKKLHALHIKHCGGKP